MKKSKAITIAVFLLSFGVAFAGENEFGIADSSEGKSIVAIAGGDLMDAASGKSVEAGGPLDLPTTQRVELAFDADIRYDENIDLAPDGFERDGFTYTFSPDVLFRLMGDDFTEQMLTVGYSPTLYFDDVDHDLNINHDFDGVYRWNSGRTIVTLTGQYSHVEGNNGRDLSKQGEALFLREQRRAESDRYSAELNIDYAISSLVDADLRVGYQRADFDTLNSYATYGTELALLYGGRDAITRIGPYVGYERVDAQANADQNAFQAGGRVEWKYSALTSFYGQAGVDSRDFEGSGAAGTSDEIVWAAGLRWSPDEMFSSELAFDRSVLPSVTSNGQNYVISTISLAIRKEFLWSCFVRGVGSYSWSEYDSTVSGVSVARQDDYYSAYIELGHEITDRGEVSVFYNFLENDSSLALQSFQNNTVGLKIAFEF